MVSRWLGEWTGPYSDKSDEMTDELKEALNHEGKVHWEVGYKCGAGFAFRIVCLNMKTTWNSMWTMGSSCLQRLAAGSPSLRDEFIQTLESIM